MKNNHNLKFEQTTFKSQKNKDTIRFPSYDILLKPAATTHI
jgi:hypothetical protein